MPRPSISSILKTASQIASTNERMEYMKKNDNVILRTVLKYAFDPEIKWRIPLGKIDYKPSKLVDLDGVLYHEARKMYIFVHGGNDRVSDERVKQLFVQFLEALDPNDAELIVGCKERDLPYPYITPYLVNEVYPGTLSRVVTVKELRAMAKEPVTKDVGQFKE